MCRRVSTLEVELEAMEGRLSEGLPVDLDLYNKLAGNLRRLIDAIGLKRIARDVTPTLSDYVAARRTAAEAELP